MARKKLKVAVRRLKGERRAQRAGGRRTTDFEPNPGWRTAAWIAGGIALLDWTVKAMVANSIPLGGFREVWEGRVALWHVRNPAMMLGLWGDLPLGVRKGIAAMAALMALLILVQVVGRGHRLPPGKRGWAWVFVGLTFGGMLGNLGERVVHWGVTDYLSFRYADIWLPPGNVADIALFLSMPLALVVILFELQARGQRGSGEPAGRPREGAAPSLPR